MLDSLAALYTRGIAVSWTGHDRDYPRRKVALPSYPFQRQRYWQDAPPPTPRSPLPASLPPLLGRRLRSPYVEGRLFEAEFSPEALPWLSDHRLFGRVVAPGACYLSMVLAAAETAGAAPSVLEDVTFPEALILNGREPRTVQLKVPSSDSEDASFQISSTASADAPAEHWTVHASGRVRPVAEEELSEARPVSVEEIRGRCRPQPEGAESFYRFAWDQGLELGPSFRWLAEVSLGDGEVLARMQVPASVDEADLAAHPLHPGLVDACFQLFGAWFTSAESHFDVAVPIAVDSFRFYRRTRGALWCHGSLRDGDPDVESPASRELSTVDFSLFEESGELVARGEGVVLRRVERDALLGQAAPRLDRWLYELQWPQRPRQPSQPAAGGAAARPGRWLIFADSGGLGARLAELAERAGERSVLIFPGEAFEACGEGRWRADPRRPQDFERLLATVLPPEQEPCLGVVHLWGLEDVPEDGLTAAALARAQELGCGSVLHLVQALARSAGRRPSGLWLVTRGAQAIAGERLPAAGMAQAPLWGLGRVLPHEHPELDCRRIDLDPAAMEDEARALWAEIRSPDREDQVAFRGDQRHVARLARWSSADGRGSHRLELPDGPFRLEISDRGTLDNLAFQPASRRSPGSGEVEIRVRAAGLNFRDVLNVLGMYPGDPGPPGLECAGEVVAIGDAVEDLEVGDAVLGIAPQCFSDFATTRAPLVVRKPAALSFEEAATVPIAFLTAAFCLRELARMAPGERVLIHAAAGGVGMAAVQLAQRCGAEVFATASPGKWPALHALGVRHTMSSRTLDFAAEVMERTEGRGVDLVLNSLADEFIAKSLAVLAPDGRFVEIGKRGIWDRQKVARERADVTYSVFDLAELSLREPQRIQVMLSQLMTEFEDGALEP
ncbi:MAG: polyketide synthase dehydratase domain-containing protein, partial [Thermoanaerobaculia bacterium]